MHLREVDLTDKYRLRGGRLYLSGTQALVRLLLVQRWRDQSLGLNTVGFVSGYRGSPLGAFDQELWRARSSLEAEHIHFWPGVNEDLAATAAWGTQMTGLHGDAAYDGVFALWYGKGAGLDRSGDAIRHANASGVNPRGGVLAVVGDDHAQKSSTQPYFSEPTFADLLVPVLYPSTVGELIEYGILGWALSRYSGVWVGLKTMGELLDCSGSIEEQAAKRLIELPPTGPPAGAVHFRWPDPWHEAEIRWVEQRLPAVHAFARHNHIDRIALRSPKPRLGIITAGKSYRDLLQALSDLGLSREDAAELGIAVYKIGMTWPLEPSRLREFAHGIPELLIIEEKRPIIEDQVRVALSDQRDRPLISGKKRQDGAWQFPWTGELSGEIISQVIAQKLPELRSSTMAAGRLVALERQRTRQSRARPVMRRPAYFCSGCPHNTSTKVPDGSRAIAGVGCHYMAVDLDRSTTTFSQMGGEGATWIGQAPFSRTRHVFVNLGEGTYFHSGSLAVRACIAAGVNVTYKLLYNDAVAMTGGQPVDGKLDVPQLAQQLYAEGIRGIHVVAETPEKYRHRKDLPPGTQVHPRAALDEVQRQLRERPGVTALIYDQTCAAEKRRRRKRRQLAEGPQFAFINAAVCEGCGDCSRTSNCLSIVPVDTELGRKRAVDQSSCNKDLSCVEGFCPSFVTVAGAQRIRPNTAARAEDASIPAPPECAMGRTWDVFVTGVGGTGVVTVGAILGMAAHLEGKACSVLDQLGMAQKGGAVVTHIRIAKDPDAISAARVPKAGADLVLGFDLVVTLQDAAFGTLAPGRTRVIVNTHETITGAFIRHPDFSQPTAVMIEALRETVGDDHLEAFDATLLATSLLGDSIATNLFMVGFALQRGLIPLSREAMVAAIRLNGVAVEANIAALDWGRQIAAGNAGNGAQGRTSGQPLRQQSPDELIASRVKLLSGYQDEAYAREYKSFLDTVQRSERDKVPGESALTLAVARSLYKLMAYKDEYEVARLYTDGTFLKSVRESFAGNPRLTFHLAPPILGRRDRTTGELRKSSFGPWMYGVFRILAAMRRLRGTRFDPFGYLSERRQERQLIGRYRETVLRLLTQLSPGKHPLAVRIAEVPLAMRGFGHVKAASVAAALAEEARLIAAWQSTPDAPDGSSPTPEREATDSGPTTSQ